MSGVESSEVRAERDEGCLSSENRGEIDLLSLLLVVAQHKKFVIKMTVGAAIFAAVISLLIPNVYRADVLLVSAQVNDDKMGGSALGGLSGMAALAGISLGGGSAEEYLAVMTSRDFLWRFAQENHLMPILFADEWDEKSRQWKEVDARKQPSQMDLHRLLIRDGVLSVSKDKRTELVTVSVEWKDAKLAADWANLLVDDANRYLAQKEIERSQARLQYLNAELLKIPVEEMRRALFDLIATEQKRSMLANTQKEFAFKVLDRAVVPDKKIKPKRAVIVILVALLAMLIASTWILVKHRMENLGEESRRAMQLKEFWLFLRRW